MKAQEAHALVDAVMDGKVQRDYVMVGGAQCERTPALFAATLGIVHTVLYFTLRAKGRRARLPRVHALADVITTVLEGAYIGKCTSSSTPSGIVLVKTRRVLVLATFAEPVNAAQAVPYVHKFADELDAAMEV